MCHRYGKLEARNFFKPPYNLTYLGQIYELCQPLVYSIVFGYKIPPMTFLRNWALVRLAFLVDPQLQGFPKELHPPALSYS